MADSFRYYEDEDEEIITRKSRKDRERERREKRRERGKDSYRFVDPNEESEYRFGRQ